MRSRLRALMLVAGALVICSSGSAVAAVGPPTSPVGPADAPSFTMEDTFVYQGHPIARDSAAALGLSCNVVIGEPTQCYDTETQALGAHGLKLPPHPLATAAAHRRRARAATACGDGEPQITYQYRNYNGWDLHLYSEWAWYDMTGMYDNETSSFYNGSHTSAYSDYYGGGGAGYPNTNYDLDTCTFVQIPYQQPTWDDRISSRYRH